MSLVLGKYSNTIYRRFWTKVRIAGGCWEWVGATVHGGYGNVLVRCEQGKSIIANAHRVSWELANHERIPEGLQVNHTCDNKLCVRPSHLWIGTQSENLQDAASKNRLWMQKVSARDARFIRKAHACGFPRQRIASMFDLGVNHVSDICARRKWAHV